MEHIKAIKTDRDYKEALAQLEKVFDAKTDEEANKAEVLVILIQDYERQHSIIEAPSPIEAIKFRMEQQELQQADLVKYIGSESRVSEILNGKRRLTLDMIASLHKGLDIPLESLIENKRKVKRKIRYKTNYRSTQLLQEPKVSYRKKKK